MKTTLVLGVVVILQMVCFGHCKDVSGIEEKCKKDTGFKKKSTNEIKFDDATKEDKCYMYCLADELGILKKDGTFDFDTLKAFLTGSKLSPDEIEKAVKAHESCAKEIKVDTKDMCETAFKLAKCTSTKGVVVNM